MLLFIAVAYLSINMGNIWLKQVFFGGASGVKGHNAEIAPQLYYCGRGFHFGGADALVGTGGVAEVQEG